MHPLAEELPSLPPLPSAAQIRLPSPSALPLLAFHLLQEALPAAVAVLELDQQLVLMWGVLVQVLAVVDHMRKPMCLCLQSTVPLVAVSTPGLMYL